MSDHWLLLITPAGGWPFVAVWLGVPLLALAVDWWLGEPPVAWHPVVWMGQALQWSGDRLAPTSPVARDFKVFWRSALVWCALRCILVGILSQNGAAGQGQQQEEVRCAHGPILGGPGPVKGGPGYPDACVPVAQAQKRPSKRPLSVHDKCN